MRFLALLSVVVLVMPLTFVAAADTPSPSANCIKAKYQGDASTYNPNLPGWKTGGQALATGGRYNPNGWEAALQLDAAKKHGCGYGSGRTCQAVVQTQDGKTVILLINDNGPLVSGRIIDLNEKSMQYLSGGRYGRNSGVLRNVTVTLLSCNFSNYLGPINAADRDAWAKDIASTNTTDLTPVYSTSNNPYSQAQVSPFSGTGAFGTQGASTGYGATSGYGATPVSSQIGAGSSPLGVSTGGSGSSDGSGGSSSSGSGDGKTGLSASTIVVQPKNARAGLVIVSWTSVNMKPASCKVLKDGEEFATGNEATKRDTISKSVEYTLECTTPSGETAVSKAAVTI